MGISYLSQNPLIPANPSLSQRANYPGIKIPRVLFWNLDSQQSQGTGRYEIDLLNRPVIHPDVGADLYRNTPFKTEYEGHINVIFNAGEIIFSAGFGSRAGVAYLKTIHNIPNSPPIVSTRASRVTITALDSQLPSLLNVPLAEFSSNTILTEDQKNGGTVGIRLVFGFISCTRLTEDQVAEVLDDLNSGETTIRHSNLFPKADGTTFKFKIRASNTMVTYSQDSLSLDVSPGASISPVTTFGQGPTLASIKQQIKQQADIENGDFVSETELVNYINEGIDTAQKLVSSISNDTGYFLTQQTQDITAGKSLYTLPNDMFSTKIKKVIYKKANDEIYTISRFRGETRIIDMLDADIDNVQNDDYRYLLIRDTTDTSTSLPKMRISPTPDTTVRGGLLIYYIRSAQILQNDNDRLDIPEATNFIVKYGIYMVLKKDMNPKTDIAIRELQFEKDLLMETLQNITSDGDNLLIPDTRFYPYGDDYGTGYADPILFYRRRR